MNDRFAQSMSLNQYLFNYLKPGEWLILEDLPSSFAENQALILCQVSSHQWLTWVPNHGEYCLTI